MKSFSETEPMRGKTLRPFFFEMEMNVNWKSGDWISAEAALFQALRFLAHLSIVARLIGTGKRKGFRARESPGIPARKPAFFPYFYASAVWLDGSAMRRAGNGAPVVMGRDAILGAGFQRAGAGEDDWGADPQRTKLATG